MNCFYHPEKEAVAQCTECNKGLCNECASRFNKPICDSCARKVLKSQLSYYWTPLIVSVVLFVVVYIICSQQALSMHDTLAYSFGLVFLYIGWKVLNSVEERYSVISGDGLAMLAFFFLKIIAVLFIGAFVTPFYLLYCIYKIVKISISLKKI